MVRLLAYKMRATSPSEPAIEQKLFQAQRVGKVINIGEYMVRSTLMGIMGQVSCYSGKEVTWEQISASELCFLPKPEKCRIDMEPPVKLDANGIYPVAFTPGESQLL